MIFLNKLINIITFTNLPIRKKFLLFSAGTLFWLIITSLIGFICIYFANQKSATILHGIVPQQDAMIAIVRKLRGANISAHKMILAQDNEELMELYVMAKTRIRDCYNILTALLSGGIVKDELRIIDKTIDGATYAGSGILKIPQGNTFKGQYSTYRYG